MQKSITLELTSKEALELLSHPGTSKKIHSKIITALRGSDVTPKGALAAATAKATGLKKKAAPKKAETDTIPA